MYKNLLKCTFIVLICFVFVDIVGADTYNNYDTQATLMSCGNGMIDRIPSVVPKVISMLYIMILIAVPVVLVIIGSIDLMKGITASKEDEIKKGQQMFIKRLISACLIFLVFLIVKLVISFAAGDGKDSNKAKNIMDCAECFINNKCD